MKWFKHLTNAMDDLFVKDLERKFGDAGYAFWFKTLELIGNHGDEGKLTISWSNYLEKLHKRRTQVELMLDFCSTSGKLLVDNKKELLNLECKKFAEYSDNYTKYGKSLQSDLKETAKQEEEEEEEVEEKKKEKKKELSSYTDGSNLEQCIYREWNRKLGHIELTTLITLGNKHGWKELFDAIEQSVLYNAKSVKYVTAILEPSQTKSGEEKRSENAMEAYLKKKGAK